MSTSPVTCVSAARPAAGSASSTASTGIALRIGCVERVFIAFSLTGEVAARRMVRSVDIDVAVRARFRQDARRARRDLVLVINVRGMARADMAALTQERFPGVQHFLVV